MHRISQQRWTSGLSTWLLAVLGLLSVASWGWKSIWPLLVAVEVGATVFSVVSGGSGVFIVPTFSIWLAPFPVLWLKETHFCGRFFLVFCACCCFQLLHFWTLDIWGNKKTRRMCYSSGTSSLASWPSLLHLSNSSYVCFTRHVHGFQLCAGRMGEIMPTSSSHDAVWENCF